MHDLILAFGVMVYPLVYLQLVLSMVNTNNQHPIIDYVVKRVKESSYYTAGDFFNEIDDITLETIFGFVQQMEADTTTYPKAMDSANIRNVYILATLLSYGEGETRVDAIDLGKIVTALATLVLLEKSIRKEPDKVNYSIYRKHYSLHDTNKIIAKRKTGV